MNAISRRRRIAFAVLFELSLGAIALLLGLLLKHPPLKALDAGIRGIAGGIAATVPLLGLLYLIWNSRIRALAALRQSVRRMVNGYFGRLSVAEAALLSVAAGIGEELLFRGFLQSWLMSLIGTGWPALLIASLAFGAVHWLSSIYFLYASLLGVVLGAVFWLTGDLLAPVICHAAYDTVALLVSRRPRGKPGSVRRSLRDTDRDPPHE